MKIVAVVEMRGTGFGACMPDLPGCAAAAGSRGEVARLVRKAMEFHVENPGDQGNPVPRPSSQNELIEVRAA